MSAGLDAHYRRGGVRRYAVQIDRASIDVPFVTHVYASCPKDAKVMAMSLFRERHPDAGQHWIKRVTEMDR